MDHDEQYSPLVRELKKTFDYYAEGDTYKALFVYTDSWGQTPHFVPVPNKQGVWPWAIFDAHPLVQLENIEKPIMAFDLTRSFAEQMPKHFWRLPELGCFHISPLYHIPDRAGIVPANERRKFEEEVLKQRPSHLQLVK